MRTTIELDADTAAALRALRRERGLGVSEAVNELMRRGLTPQTDRAPFRQTTRAAGIKIDVSDVAGALDILEGSDAR